MPGTVKPVLVVVAASLVAGAISNSTAGPTRKLRWIASPAAAGTPTPEPTPGAHGTPALASTPEAPARADFEIETPRALEEHGKGTLFLDARPSDVYNQGHVPQARSFAVWEADVDDKVMTLQSEFPPETPFVVYCSGGKCEDSHLLRGKLLAAGFVTVLVDVSGYPGWTAAGHPVEK